jgi:hypothetical protein
MPCIIIYESGFVIHHRKNASKTGGSLENALFAGFIRFHFVKPISIRRIA